MTVNLIVDGNLLIDISEDEELGQRLAELELVEDGIFDINDIYIGDFRETVADTMVAAGTIDEAQRDGMLRFFKTYADAQNFHSGTAMLIFKGKSNITGKKLQFKSNDWNNSVLPFFNEEAFANDIKTYIGNSLEDEIRHMLQAITGAEVDNAPNARGGDFKIAHVPAIVRPHVREIVTCYESGMKCLEGYDEIVCDDRGCNKPNKIRQVLLDADFNLL